MVVLIQSLSLSLYGQASCFKGCCCVLLLLYLFSPSRFLLHVLRGQRLMSASGLGRGRERDTQAGENRAQDDSVETSSSSVITFI